MCAKKVTKKGVASLKNIDDALKNLDKNISKAMKGIGSVSAVITISPSEEKKAVKKGKKKK